MASARFVPGRPDGAAAAGAVEVIGWLDTCAGASGDMLLGALFGIDPAGGPVRSAVVAAVEAVGLGVRDSRVDRGGLAAWKVDVVVPPGVQPGRNLTDIRRLLRAADLDPAVRERADRVFVRLAAAEATVHGTSPEEVHFHEVGALDALADVVGGCAGLAALRLAALHATPVALGGGRAPSRHGQIPVPAPAVLELLRAAGAPAYGGSPDIELCTPTGAALLAEWVTGWGTMPPMTVGAVGVGAGDRELPAGSNVLRLVTGEPVAAEPAQPPGGDAVVIECNVDDLDPRIWPGVLERLLELGAGDAWLTPMLMKKGRPAHVLSVLCRPELAPGLRREVFRQTSTIGLRQHPVAKFALARSTVTVTVAGERIAVKTASLDGVVVNASPEFDEVVAAADRLGRPVKEVLAAAVGAVSAAGRPPGGGAVPGA